MTCNPNTVDGDLSTHIISFVYKETPTVETLIKVCPVCVSRCIHKTKSHAPKQNHGRAKLQFTPSGFKCSHCGNRFRQPNEITKVMNRLKPLPMDLKRIADKKKTPMILSPSEKP